jgi:hypothetical protein
VRCLLKVELCVETANAAIRDGSFGKTIRSILDDLKPEAAYFLASNGKRTAYLFLNMQDASQIPSLAEPWFLAFRANIEIVPVMIADDLKKAELAFEQAVNKYAG